jgi:hypothetical protein
MLLILAFPVARITSMSHRCPVKTRCFTQYNIIKKKKKDVISEEQHILVGILVLGLKLNDFGEIIHLL